jgi:CBS domain containing-hemolysin-like protein
VIAWQVSAVVALVGLNAFFVTAEFALVAVRRTRIEELVAQGSRRAQTAMKTIKELNLMLSGCQLGITLASLGLGWVGEPALAHLVERAFRSVSRPFNLVLAHGVASGGAFVLITFFHVVLGEQVPKYIAIGAPEGAALWVASPIRAFTYAFRPLIWAFNEAANGFIRLLGMKPQHEGGALHTPDELAIIVEESRRGGELDKAQSEILTRTLEFAEKRAIDAMVPRVAATTIEASAPVEQVLDLAERTGYSRFPVWRDRADEFVGVAYLKDALRSARHHLNETVGEVMREPLLVPESLHLEEVLHQIRKSRTHFAIVLDEFGSTSGILTLEDILEELVGEIRDEYDHREHEIRKVGGAYRVPGTIRPDELEELVGLTLPEGEYETVAGFIFERLGRLARRGDELVVDGFRIRVVNVSHHRIVSVDVRPPGEPAKPQGPGTAEQ